MGPSFDLRLVLLSIFGLLQPKQKNNRNVAPRIEFHSLLQSCMVFPLDSPLSPTNWDFLLQSTNILHAFFRNIFYQNDPKVSYWPVKILNSPFSRHPSDHRHPSYHIVTWGFWITWFSTNLSQQTLQRVADNPVLSVKMTALDHQAEAGGWREVERSFLYLIAIKEVALLSRKSCCWTFYR